MLTFRNFSKVSHSERQYLNLINHLLLFGEKEKGRNGNVITTTGTGMRFSLKIIQYLFLLVKKKA